MFPGSETERPGTPSSISLASNIGLYSTAIFQQAQVSHPSVSSSPRLPSLVGPGSLQGELPDADVALTTCLSVSQPA